MERQLLLPQYQSPFPERSKFPEVERRSLVLATDVEGPLYLGDFIAEAMDAKLGPKNRDRNSHPSYGQIMYQETWDWFTSETLHSRRGNGNRQRESLSISQEGTDTIFTLPLLLAEETDMAYLEELTLKSKNTPGSQELISRLQRESINIFGITTAPQEPYRKLVEERQLMEPKQIIGSPFPMEEARQLLIESGRWQIEIPMVQSYLEGCYQIIDEHTSGNYSLTEEGRSDLRKRIKYFHEEVLGITYDPPTRKARGLSPTILGHFIESSAMVGDRAKAAIAQYSLRATGTENACLVTMGDGANDAEMLKRAPISIGVNGPDAARAAKIAVVTDDMTTVLPIFEQVLEGQRDIQTIIDVAQRSAGSRAVICQGGPDIPETITRLHKDMKKRLRGHNITY